MHASVSVIVTGAYDYGGPLDRNYPADTPIATVRDAAIKHFKLTQEPASSYHLTVHDERLDETATIGELTGIVPNVVLKLVEG